VEATKRELRRRGVTPAAVKQLLTQAVENSGASPAAVAAAIAAAGGGMRASAPAAAAADDDDDDERNTSHASGRPAGGGKPKYARHPGDVKKIADLEAEVTDLQESLRKRTPDSVSNLIRAATVGETVQEERRAHAQVTEPSPVVFCVFRLCRSPGALPPSPLLAPLPGSLPHRPSRS